MRRCLRTASFIVASGLLSLLSVAGCGGGEGEGSNSTPTVILTPSPSTGPSFHYTVSEIVKLPYKARFVARNQNGFVVGYRYSGDEPTSGEPPTSGDNSFILSPNGALTAIPHPEGLGLTTAVAIDNNSNVVGRSARNGYGEGTTGFVYDSQTGKTSLLTSLIPSAINDFGKIAGRDFQLDSQSGQTISTGYVYDIASGTREKLPNFIPSPEFEAPAQINNAGWVVGTSDDKLALFNINSKQQRTVRPTGIYTRTVVKALSENGIVSGVDYDNETFGKYRGFLYDIASDIKTYLPVLPPADPYISSFPLNAAGVAVLQTPGANYVFREGRLQELRTTLSAEDQALWKFRYTFAIDSSGVIYASCEQEQTATAAPSTTLVRLTPQ